MRDVPPYKEGNFLPCGACREFLLQLDIRNKETLVIRETMEGYIGYEAEGENGFGYDPIFYLEEFGCSSAALSREQKNEISHRGKALRAMKDILLERGTL